MPRDVAIEVPSRTLKFEVEVESNESGEARSEEKRLKVLMEIEMVITGQQMVTISTRDERRRHRLAADGQARRNQGSANSPVSYQPPIQPSTNR